MTTTSTRILVTDDDALALKAAAHLLTSAGYEVFSAINGEQTLQLVAMHQSDLLLLDVVLPDIEGTEVCRCIKADPQTSEIFVILLSGSRTASDEQSQGMEGGADGYIARPIANRELLARTDGLTGLCNRRYFFELAAREFHSAVRYQHPLTFIMLDMDDFKQVNDTLGHIAGDKLLAMVAQAVAVPVRASDVVARYGGDEFIIMLPQASAQQALPVAVRILASVAALRPNALQDDKEPSVVTFSIGIAEMRHEPVDENFERIIQRADQAMYKAKQSGRNRIVIFGQ